MLQVHTAHVYAFKEDSQLGCVHNKYQAKTMRLISTGAQQPAGGVAFPPAVPPRPLATQVHVIIGIGLSIIAHNK